MKTSAIILLIAGVIGAVACEEKKGPYISDNATPPSITSPSTGASLVMSKPQAAQTTSFSWSPANYGVPVGILYTLQASKSGDNFAHPVNIVSVNRLGDTLSYADFNGKMIALETNMETANPVDLRVQAYVPGSAADTLYSQPISMIVTPYTAKDFIYLVGQHNGWNNATANVMNRNLPGLKYELYLNLPAVDGGFKILPTLGSWDGDMGDDPANPGHLLVTGEQNMKAPTPGFYRISVDLQAMTWTATKMTFGLIGDFNNWAADYPMTYDVANNVWTATVNIPAAGGLKFRANGSWAVNYGDKGADGKLEEGGDNIQIAAPGNYQITLNLNPTGNPQSYTYSVTKI